MGDYVRPKRRKRTTPEETDTASQAERIATALMCERKVCPCHKWRNGKGRVHCPTHDDDNPAFEVKDKSGKPLVRCFVGCSQEAVIQELKERGLWMTAPGLKLSELAEAKGIPESWLRALGVRESRVAGKPCVVIPYLGSDGREMAVQKRLRLTGVMRFMFRSGDKMLPYGLPYLPRARKAGYAIIVEGPTDCWAGWFNGLEIIGMPGASSWRSDWAHYFKDIGRIYLWHEPDKGGDSLAARVLADLPDALLIEPPPGIKDLNDLWLSLGRDVGVFRERMEALLQSARPLSDIRAEALSERGRELLTASEGVLDDRALLHRMVLSSEELGHAADRHNLARVHLGLATVKQPSPAAVVVKGQSSTGKNSMVEAARKVWPDHLVIWRSGVSPKALAYSKEDFRNRYLVLAEAHTLQTADGAYLLKSLISEKRIAYETVIDGEAVTLAQEGPTGMIATTTRSFLDAELETRCWILEARESVEYNQAALKAIAGRFNGAEPAIDERLRAGLEWLLLAGDTRVDMRYARWLAKRVPAELPESKRLFERLLSAIAASAWLHQRQRSRNEGKIIANVADYAMTVGLFEEAFTIGTTGITKAQRRVLEAMKALTKETYNPNRQMSIREIAKKVGALAEAAGEKAGTNPGTVEGHLIALQRRGLVYREKKGDPWQLLDDPPDAIGLPHPQILADNFPDLSASWIGPVSGKRFTLRPPGNPPNGPTPNPASNTSPNTNDGVGSDTQQALGTQRSPTPEPNGSKPPDLHTKSAKNGKGVGPLGRKPRALADKRQESNEMRLF